VIRDLKGAAPRVLENDDGIRPAGKPDECFYCKSKVGEIHGDNCPCVMSLFRFDVFIGEQMVGEYEEYLPYHWDHQMAEFSRNESTWCAGNAEDRIRWSSAECEALYTSTMAKLRAGAEDPEDYICPCGVLRFEFDQVVKEGPFVDIRENEQAAATNPSAFERTVFPNG